MFGFLGNTHVPHRKNTAHLVAVPLPAPKEVLLSLSQHIGAPAVATVKVGDTVKKGQKIADAGGFVSAPVHASVSGTVTKIEEYLKSDGRTVTAIRIANDFENTISEEVAPPTVTNVDELLAAVTASGLIGLGGAGFPTHVKLAALKNEATDTLVINGAECEPYITSDTRTMLEDGEDIFDAVATLRRVAPSLRRVIFGEGAIPCDENLFDIAQATSEHEIKPRILMIEGTRDFMYDTNIKLKEKFESLNYEYHYMEAPGGHTWGFWDKYTLYALKWLLQIEE